VIVSELIVVDVAIFAFLIMIATVIVVSRGRRGNRRLSARREAAAAAGAGMDPRATPLTPGLRAEVVEPDPGGYQPAEPEQAEPEQAEPEPPEPERAEPEPERAVPERAELEPAESERAEPEQAGPEPPEPEQAGPEPPEPEQAGSNGAAPDQAPPAQVSEAATAEPGLNGSAAPPDGPAREPDGRQGGTGAVTGSGHIGSYYEGADRPIADYLAARGWPEEPGTHDPAGHA
jgi:hypothetical protein